MQKWKTYPQLLGHAKIIMQTLAGDIILAVELAICLVSKLEFSFF